MADVVLQMPCFGACFWEVVVDVLAVAGAAAEAAVVVDLVASAEVASVEAVAVEVGSIKI